MKKVKNLIIRFLSGIEMSVRHFLIPEPEGESLDLRYGTGPRVMSTVVPVEQADFNSWANHVHKEILNRYKSKIN
jgi:hypothetical protein